MQTSATPTAGGLSLFFQDIKLAHSVFALPFAAVGFLLSGALLPSAGTLLLLLLCMVSARSFAMGLNRYLDRHIDARNPRTNGRMIPSGQLPASRGLGWSLVMAGIFVFTAFRINPLTGWLSGPLLLILGFYSLMKRISALTHWYLGFCLGLAPVAVSVALTGTVNLAVILTGIAVMFWTAGFDILYSLQDISFDKKEGLRSIPALAGVKGSLIISRLCFFMMILNLAVAGGLAGRGWLYFTGVLVVGMILAYEQWLVKDCVLVISDIQINRAFFTVNGWVSVAFYILVQLDASLLS